MHLRRILSMGFAELSCRARQQVAKRIDRRADPHRGALAASRPAGRIDGLLEEMAGHFFEGPSDPRLPVLVRERLPESASHVVAAADRILGKRFDLLGYHELSFGDPIDWHLDPVSKRQTPMLHWTRLDPLDAATVGDSKVVWELNRHQWLVGLGQAYRLTGDERYAAAFADTIWQWLQANPPGMGINWTSSLEAAFRLISWCWTLSLFRGSAALTPPLRAALVEGIARHAARIERYLSYYFSPNTHLTGEALGLFYAGTLLPGLPAAPRWRRVAIDILVAESGRQILPDGVYVEQSTCYQRYTAEIYLHFLMLAARNGTSVPAEVIGRLERLLDALLTFRRPDGSLPQIGDADGGWLLPLEARRPDDARGVFGIAATVLGRADYAWASDGHIPEVAWFLGTEGLRLFDRLNATPPVQRVSRVLPDGGYVVMRSDWGAGADQIIFDVGPLGCSVSGGHGHADLLSVQCSFRGRPYVADAGTFHYRADDGWRDHFRGTAVHSTVDIDGAGQAVPVGPFQWQTRPSARLIHWEFSSSRDVAIGEHGAYRRLADPVTHRRQVILQKGRHCIVVDDLDGRAEHRVELRWQFAPMTMSLEAELWARAVNGQGTGLIIHTLATVPLKASLLEGETDPRQGWISTGYGELQAAPLLLYSAVTSLPIRVVTLLIPTDDPLGVLPSVSAVLEHGRLSGVVLDGAQTSRFADAP